MTESRRRPAARRPRPCPADARPSPSSSGRAVRRPPHRPGGRRPGQDARGRRAAAASTSWSTRPCPRRSASAEPLAPAEPRPQRARGARRAARAGRRATRCSSPMIGLGYYGTLTPPVDPAQRAGEPRLVHRLHALPAGDQPGPARGAAQLPDRGRGPDRPADRRRLRCSTRRTAAAEAMTLMRRRRAGRRPTVFVVDADALPQTLGRAADPGRAARASRSSSADRRRDAGLPDGDVLRRAAVSTRATGGASATSPPLIAAAHERGALVAVATDLLALTLLRPPGEIGADVAVGHAPSASACRWASAVRTPASWPCAPGSSAPCPAGWSGVSVDADGAPGLPARAADPRAAHPPREGDVATSAPRRCCSP